MAISKTGKTLISYNVKNGQYALLTTASTPTTAPVFASVASLTWLTKFSKEKNLATTERYGDGDLQLLLVNDKGFTGTIGMTARDEEYEEALGFLLDLDVGSAEVKQLLIKEHAIYFESEYMGNDGDPKVKKTWVYGVTATAPSETFDQNTENINATTIEYTITIRGIPLKDSTGTADYTNTNGETLKVFTYSKKPTDTDYATFGDTCPVPKMAAEG